MSDIDYSYYLSWIAIKLPVFFSYFMPWIGLSSSIFACAVLYLSKHSEVTPVIFIFKCQYVIGFIYALNMIFNDPMFTSSLFPYNPNEFVSNAFCKVQTIIMHFFYCISPWIQVVITFDRLWVCYLKETIRISRNKMTLFLVILFAFGLILLSSIINAWFFIVKIETYQDIFNSTLNKTIQVNVTVYRCLQSNDDFALVQDILFNVMRVGLPFVIIFVSNIALLWYVHTLRNSVARAINHNSRQRRENNFTIAVCSKNLAFLVLSICYFAYAIIAYALKFSGVLESFTQLQLVQFILFQRISTLLSYMYTLIEFWVELIFNRIFRAEILRALNKIDTIFRRARN